MLLRLPLHHPAGGPPPRDKLGEDQACGSPRRRTRGSARRSNGRRPVRWCSNRTSVAARLSVRTPDGESRETVRSALWHRGATAKTSWTGLARVLAVIPSGLAPLLGAGADRSRSRCPSALATLAAKRAPAVKRRREAKRRPPIAPVAGRHITDMVHFVKIWFGWEAERLLSGSPRRKSPIQKTDRNTLIFGCNPIMDDSRLDEIRPRIRPGFI